MHLPVRIDATQVESVTRLERAVRMAAAVILFTGFALILAASSMRRIELQMGKGKP